MQIKLVQQNVSAALSKCFKVNKKKRRDSKKQHTNEEAIAKWIGCTGLQVTTPVDEYFVVMMDTVDRRLNVLRKTNLSNLIDKQYEDVRKKIKKVLAASQGVSTGIDL